MKKGLYLFFIIFVLYAQSEGNLKRLSEPPGNLEFALSPKPSYGPLQSYTITLKANDYSIDISDDYHQLTMKDFGFLSVPGKPELPSKNFAIALPPEANVISVSIVEKQEILLDGKFNIKPSPPVLPTSATEEDIKRAMEEYEKNYKETYFVDKPYPEEIIQPVNVGNLRKWRYVSVRFTPFQYKPKSKLLSHIKNVVIKIDYTLPLKIKTNLSDTFFDQKAKRFFINYEEAKKWYELKTRSEKNNKHPSYPYFILIPDESYINSFWNFGLWKARLVSPDTVVYATMDWVINNFPGRDAAEKVRNALKWLYENHGLIYTLLIGEVWQIPMRECWPDPANHQRRSRYNPVPTDYYYADLTGNWDSDNDGYFGEFGQDRVDFAAEIYVGRINLYDTSIVRRILNKTVAFEQNTGSWKRRALLLGTFVDFWAPTDNALMFELIKDTCLVPNQWSYIRLYEKGGIWPSQYPCEDSINRNRVIYWWQNYPFGFVNWGAHGGETLVVRTVLRAPGDTIYPKFFIRSDVFNLNDNYPSIVYSNACLTGIPDTTFYCLGDYLHYRGAVAFIGASRVSYYLPGWSQWRQGGNNSLNCYFVWWLVVGVPWLGAALYDSKLEYFRNNYEDWTDQHNLFVYNLWGDPFLYWPGYTGIEEANNFPIISPLLKIHQNPFLDKFSFKYHLPTDAKELYITIFDVSGKIIKKLTDLPNQKGWHMINWDWKNNKGKIVPSGIYFLNFKVDNFIQSKKIIKLK